MFKNVRGTKDFLPNEQIIRNRVRRILEETFEVYGYQPVESTILCEFDLLASKYAGGAEILKEVYTLSDRGDRKLGLRYDLTVPFAKVVGMSKDLRLPFKRYEIGKVFRDGPVKKGRMREFTQCDVDVVGVNSMIAEAEYMAMVFDVFNKLELDVEIAYNNRKLLYGILLAYNIPELLRNEAILTLDKLAKIGSKGVKEELLSKGLDIQSIDGLLKLYAMDFEDQLKSIKNIVNSDIGLEGLNELESLGAFAKSLGIDDNMKFDPFLARGLDIYTGSVFEIFMKDNTVTSSIGAGGRYDKIITGFIDDGKSYPAVGISFGLDVIYTVLMEKAMDQFSYNLDLLIVSMDEELFAYKVADKYRKQGLKVDIDVSNRKLNKIMTRANKDGVRKVIVLGERERQEGEYLVKDMLTGEKITERLQC